MTVKIIKQGIASGIPYIGDMEFDGDTYEENRDQLRLGAQMLRVYDLMTDGQWRSLSEIAAVTGDPESSISARLRDLRKKKFGGRNIQRKYVVKGLFRYRIKS